jgi:octaprenyl-diphosphate synthase
MLVILSALASGYNQNDNLHLTLSCIIEYMHTATLLHDDVLDNSDYRRHQPTAHKIWGNTASILSGDLLYAKAFKLIAELQMPGLLSVLSKATEQIVAGELEHLQCLRKITTSKLTYLNIISAKTAKLFSVAASLGALLADTTVHADALEEYGHHLGIIFQIMDDILDISAPENLGKPRGQDVLEGKPTLPLILAYTHSSPTDQALMEKQFANPETTLDDLMPFITASNALSLARQEAHAASLLAENCLNTLPDTAYKQALYDLLQFALQRDH